LKTEEAFLKTQLQALLLESLQHNMQVLTVLLQGAIVDTNVVEVDGYELV
jgi:hypothetical protein